MGKKTPAQKMKEKIKKRKDEKELFKDMAKNMGNPDYMRGMGLMIRQIAPKPPKPPAPPRR